MPNSQNPPDDLQRLKEQIESDIGKQEAKPINAQGELVNPTELVEPLRAYEIARDIDFARYRHSFNGSMDVPLGSILNSDMVVSPTPDAVTQPPASSENTRETWGERVGSENKNKETQREGP